MSSSKCEILRISGGNKGFFWPCKYLSMNDKEVAMARNQCHMMVDGVNNLLKKRVSCKDNSLAKSF